MSERALCGVIRTNGTDCDGPVPPDSPVNICVPHMQEAYLYVRDRIAAREGDGFSYGGRFYDLSPAHHPSASVVYYLRFRDMIKIGTTTDLWKRISDIPYDRLLAIEPGGRELEKVRHEEFSQFRFARNREWFEDCNEIRRHVNALRRTYGDPVEKRYDQEGQVPLARLVDVDAV